jgi:hypothetical protein
MGAPTQDLLQFYCSIIRSTLEYGDVLWHGGLTNAQSANIERVKKRAFRRILPGVEYFVASNHLKMQTLSERRENHCIDLIVNLCSIVLYITLSFLKYSSHFNPKQIVYNNVH